MPAHKKPWVGPSVKSCTECGAEYQRHPRWGQPKWDASKCCSLGCNTRRSTRLRIAARPPRDERFWSKVDKTPGQGPRGDCWCWTGGLLPDGYGRDAEKSGSTRAHRTAYELATGTDPGDLMVCHTCDKPPCCNPEHLFLGTHDDNMADKAAKGRAPHSERHHRAKLTAAQVLAIRTDPKPYKTLAAEYGVSFGLIGMIKRRAIWKHLP